MYLIALFLLSFGFAQSELASIAQATQRPMGITLNMFFWEDLPTYDIVLSNEDAPSPVTMPGYFSLAWDNSNLYVLGVFEQDEATLMADLTADAPEWWKADTFEVFIRQNPEDAFVHVAANPAGIRFREFLDTDNYHTDNQIENDRWALMLSLPLGDLLAKAKPGDIWELKVARGHVALKEFSIWPMGKDFLAEDNFGKLVFVNAPLSENELLELIP